MRKSLEQNASFWKLLTMARLEEFIIDFEEEEY
jgi:hypothetical protein